MATFTIEAIKTIHCSHVFFLSRNLAFRLSLDYMVIIARDIALVNYTRGINSLFNSEYKKMKKVVEEFNSEYFDLNATTYSYECYARIIDFIISFVIFFIVPIKNEEYKTFFMKKYDLAFVNLKNGYQIKKYKIVLRYLICFFIPFIS